MEDKPTKTSILKTLVHFCAKKPRLIKKILPDFNIFLVFTVILACTESIGIGLIIPLLETSFNEKTSVSFPFMQEFMGLLPQDDIQKRLYIIGMLLGSVILMRSFAQFTLQALSKRIAKNISLGLMSETHDLLGKSNLQFAQSEELGWHVNAVQTKAEYTGYVFVAAANIIGYMLVAGIFFLFALAVNWTLAIATIIFFGVITILIKSFTSRSIIQSGKKMIAGHARTLSYLHDSITGAFEVRGNALRDYMQERYHAELESYKNNQLKWEILSILPHVILPAVGGVFICGAIIGMAFLHSGEDTAWIASLIIFIAIIMRMTVPLSVINNSIAEFVKFTPVLDTVLEYQARAQAQVERHGGKAFHGLSKSIQFEDVSFSYQDQSSKEISNTLHGINFEIEKGTSVALIGPSGSGKSTIISLLLALYQPHQGKILIDNNNLNDVSLQDWRKKIGLISQHTYFFNDTISRNIALDFEVSEDDIQEAARLSMAADFITDLPEGYHTSVGENGAKLSAGQKQRLAIARALIHDPEILILDEATSNLDAITEKILTELFDSYKGKKTMLVIAHRLQTVQNVDKIIVLKDGKIIDQGSHEDLLSRSQFYNSMIQSQNL